jgi:hypothetical protein
VPNPGNPQDLNRYAYVRNNPLKYIDPTGHEGYTRYGWADDSGSGRRRSYWFALSCHYATRESNPFVGAATTTALAVACEWCDWGMTFAAWSEGDFSWLDLLGLLPLIPGTLDNFGDAIRALERVREIGRWVQRNEHMSEAARAYQRFISGRTDDLVFEVGGYTFDAFDEVAGVLGDSKAIPGHFVDPATSTFKPWVSGTDTWLQQAANQVGAAGGVPITWYFDNQATRDAMYNLFLEQNPALLESIDLVFKPMP